MRLVRPLSAAVLALLSTNAGAVTIWKYVITHMTVTDLAVTPTEYGQGFAINDFGDVVGVAESDAVQYAFHHKRSTNVVTLISRGSHPALRGINNSGLAVGEYHDTGAGLSRAFYWMAGFGEGDLQGNPAPNLGFDWHAAAESVNDSGAIVGHAHRIMNPNLPDPPAAPGDCYYGIAARWTSMSAAPTSLFCPAWGPERAEITATDVNSAGSAVGNDLNANNFASKMFLWKKLLIGPSQLVAVPLPPSSASITYGEGEALGLNDKLHVVGTAFHPSGSAAFLWDGASAQSQALGWLPGGDESGASDVNEQQMVVGWSDGIKTIGTLGSFSYNAAFIWHPHFGMKQLPALSGGLLPATCVAHDVSDRNSSGMVYATGRCRNAYGVSRAVRWDITVGLQQVVIPQP